MRRRARLVRLFVIPAALILASPPTVGAGTDSASGLRGVQPREVVLDNGLTLLLIERHEEPSVACGVFYDVGGVNDPRGKSGIAHLFEHMLFKGSRIVGTKNYEAERPLITQQDELREGMIAEMNAMRVMKRRGEIDDVLDPEQWTPEYREMKKAYDALIEKQREHIINNELFNLYTTNGGAMLNAGTMADLTLYFVQLPANKLELFMWLESDRMTNGIMREFYVEQFNVREERRLRVESTPTGKYKEAFEALFWQSHPYGIPVIGWPSEVESITRDDVRDFYRIYYAPNNARVVLVGDFDADAAIDMAKRYFGRIPRGKIDPPPVLTEEPKPISHRRLSAEADTNPRVQIRYHTVAIGHTDEAALDLLSGLLSGKTGRLFKRLVTKKEVAIGTPRGENRARKYAGYFELDVTVKEGHDPEDVERLVMEEIDKLRKGEITDRELQKVKNQVLARSVRRLKSNVGLMFQLGIADTWLDWTYLNDAPAKILGLGAADVRRVVNKYFNHDTRTVAVYRTKKAKTAPTAGATEEDPQLTRILANIPPDRQPRFRMMVERLKQFEDATQLEIQAAAMERRLGSGQVSEAQAEGVGYMLKLITTRLAELEAGKKESD